MLPPSFKFLIPLLLIATPSHPQLPSKLKLEEELQRERMVVMTRQLGVTCNHCHDNKNFTSDKKIAFKIAKDHIRLTQVLIDSGMDGQNHRPKADCYLCHRGKALPDYKEPFNPLTMKKLKPGAKAGDKTNGKDVGDDEENKAEIQITN